MSSRQHFDIPFATRLLFVPMRLMLRFGMVERVGKLFRSANAKRNPEYFANYTPTVNDIIIATLARSGTHWMMQITLQIAHRGQADYTYIYDEIVWPEYFPNAVLQLDEPIPPSSTGLRVIKTHLEQRFVPLNDVARYITVVRDPKEFFVSTYHFAPQAMEVLGWKQVTPQKWFELFMADLLPFDSWSNHTASWWAHRDQSNVMVIPFNYLKADMTGYIDKISDFLGVELTADERANVIEKSSFAYMKEHNYKFSPIPANTKVVDIVRSGKTGSGKELLSSEQMRAIDDKCKRDLHQLGSDFPYDEVFG